jgi:acyl-CoA synthetase (AMP-forming)/AMP-acid ligase II
LIAPVATAAPPTAVDLLRRCVERAPGEPAFTHASFEAEGGPASLTYAELHRQAGVVAARLAELELDTRPVMLLYPVGLAFPPAFFGAMLAGAVPVPVPLPQFEAQYARLEQIVADCRPRALLSTAATLRRLDARLAEGSRLRATPWLATDEERGAGASALDPRPVDPEAVAFLQYTSGSTAEPRGVAISHANLAHTVAMIHGAFGWTEESGRIVSWLPHFHDMGLVVATVIPLRIGGETISMTPLAFLQRPLRWLQLLSRYQAPISGAPPFGYELCSRAAERADPELLGLIDLSAWRIAFVGAEPIRPAVLARFARTFAPYGFDERAFIPCYGMAEATLLVSAKPPGSAPTVHALSRAALSAGQAVPAADGAVTLMSCGYPAPGTRVRVVDPERRVALPDRQVGEVWIAGPQVARGYWTPAPAAVDPFGAVLADTGEGPFLRSGDLGFMVGDELVFVDRLKDMVVVNGQKYVCHELEQLVGASSPHLAPDRCAVATLEEDGGARLLVLAELSPSAVAFVDEIASVVRAALFSAHGLAASTIAFVRPNKLSRTTSGKLRRRASRDRFLDGELRVLAVVGRRPGSRP